MNELNMKIDNLWHYCDGASIVENDILFLAMQHIKKELHDIYQLVEANTYDYRPFIAQEPRSNFENVVSESFWHDKSIMELNLPIRAVNVLLCEQINTIGQLLRYSELDLLKCHNMGKKSLKDIKEALALKQLTLKA